MFSLGPGSFLPLLLTTMMHRVHVNNIISKTTSELDTPATMGILPSVGMGAVLPAVVAVVPLAVSPGVDSSVVGRCILSVAASVVGQG